MTEMGAPRPGALSSDDLIKRGLRRPEFLIVDGAAGLDKAHRRRLGRRAGPTLHGS
jgi:hypothetical protein